MRRIAVRILVGLALFSPVFLFSEGLEFSGRMTNDAALSYAEAAGVFSFSNLGSLTLNAVTAERSESKAEASLVFSLLSGDAAGQAEGWALSGDAAMLFDVRKLYLALYGGHMDFSVGRQILNFGRGRVFSPVDLFSSVSFADLGVSRIGSDTARLLIPIGDLSGFEAIAGLREFETGIFASRLSGVLFSTDAALTALYDAGLHEFSAGFDFKGDLVAGLYGEAVYHFSEYGDYGYLEAMAGADYSVSNRVFFTLEYYYNGASILSEGYRGQILRKKQFEGGHNLYANISLVPSELLSLGLSGLWNIQDEAVLAQALIAYSLFQNADLSAAGQYQTGDPFGKTRDAEGFALTLRVEVLF